MLSTRYTKLVYASLSVTLLGMLSFALVAEHYFGIRPCELCMFQRYFMGGAFLCCLLACVFASRCLYWLAILAFSGCVAFASYQVGVEYHWWPSLFGCTQIGGIDESLDLTQQLSATNFVPCDKPSWWIFGISATIWTFLSLTFLWLISCLMVYLTRSSKN